MDENYQEYLQRLSRETEQIKRIEKELYLEALKIESDLFIQKAERIANGQNKWKDFF